ncbi:hypothetical protein QYE76_029604 [Lolium multiflorum]|uniref:Uncharacterized protein n=1 Tax=Lolium multiflorum TaxID=4521 RepID=A0AAD8VI19_LOLMU|nr:hypothetical protein QYE76_029604 [Lolium multiflorum]
MMSRRDESTTGSRLPTTRSPKSAICFQWNQDGFGILHDVVMTRRVGAASWILAGAAEKGQDRGSGFRCIFFFSCQSPLAFSLGLPVFFSFQDFCTSVLIHVVGSSSCAVIFSLFGLIRCLRSTAEMQKNQQQWPLWGMYQGYTATINKILAALGNVPKDIRFSSHAISNAMDSENVLRAELALACHQGHIHQQDFYLDISSAYVSRSISNIIYRLGRISYSMQDCKLSNLQTMFNV